MTNPELLERITLNPSICSGKPCIKGTRIEITIILDALAEGLNPEEIIAHYPSLTLLDIRAAVAYASELARENLLEGFSIVKIKLDENLSTYLKESLQLEGYDVETVADEGLQGQPDVEIGAAVRREERMLLTLDVEFADLRKYPPDSHPGVILFRPRTMGPLTVNRFVMQFVQENDLRQFARCVVIVDPERVRIRFPE